VHLWALDREGEARSVLYVGASRAQQLLILAIHHSRSGNVLTALDRDAVHYTQVPDCAPPAKKRGARPDHHPEADLFTLA
jgi:ATP-dependent exoDNAse (exonuclease V) beta subunit